MMVLGGWQLEPIKKSFFKEQGLQVVGVEFPVHLLFPHLPGNTSYSIIKDQHKNGKYSEMGFWIILEVLTLQ